MRESGCRICGVTNDILRDPTRRANRLNPYGALKLETHHQVIDWALASAIDPEKFNHSILPALHQQHGTAVVMILDRVQIATGVNTKRPRSFLLL